MLGEQIGQPPCGGGHHTELASRRQFRPVGQYNLRVSGELFFRDFAFAGGKRMAARGDHQEEDGLETLAGERVRYRRQ